MDVHSPVLLCRKQEMDLNKDGLVSLDEFAAAIASNSDEVASIRGTYMERTALRMRLASQKLSRKLSKSAFDMPPIS